MMFLRTCAVSALLPLTLLASLPAQQRDTFRSQTNLVLVPVEVRKHGQHVSGLGRDQFTVLQDGKPQKISVFEEVRTTTERLKRVAVGPHGFTNEYEGNPATARYTVIAIDRINTTTMDMQRLRIGLLKFLNQVADAGEPIRLIAINRSSIEILQDFTTDPKILAMALSRRKTAAGRANESSTSSSTEAIEEIENTLLNAPDAQAAHAAERIDALEAAKDQEQNVIAFQQRDARISSLEALQMVAQSLAGLPGRKSLVWASSGYPFGISVREGVHKTSLDFSQVIEAGNLDEYTMHLLNDANIAVYPVDARGTVNTAYQAIDPSNRYSPTLGQSESARSNNEQAISTFEHLASATGGEPCIERADLSGCFKDAIDDSRDYYLVGYYIDPALKVGWHKLQVKVAADGSVRSRAGFQYTRLDPNQMRAADMRLQLSSLLVDPAIPFRGEWTLKEAKGDKKIVGFEMNIPPSARVISEQDPHLNLEIVAIARSRDGNIAGQFAQKIDRELPPPAISTIQSDGIDYRNVMPLPKGKFLVRIVVRDNTTGRMGSATTIVQVD